MKSLYGHDTYKIDGQSRFQTPLNLYKIMFPLRDQDTELILTSGPDYCLYAFTPKVWEYYVKQMRNIDLPHDQKLAMLRRLLSHANLCKVDTQRRVRIPDVLKEYAKIKKDVEIIGFMDRLELWSPQVQKAYQAKLDNAKFDYDDPIKRVFIDMMPKDSEEEDAWDTDAIPGNDTDPV